MAGLTLVDLLAFGLHFVALVGMGFYVGRKRAATSEEYFLAGRKLPWSRNLAVWWAVFAAGIIACYFVFSGLFFR
jgi:Na+/proline symporter